VTGVIRPTGIRPKLSERLAENNVHLDPKVFEPTLAAGRS
jgi:hypothetical protein